MLTYIFSKVIFLSLSGSLVILLLLALSLVTQKRLSKRWNYYIWLVALVVLTAPVSWNPWPAPVPTEEAAGVDAAAEAYQTERQMLTAPTERESGLADTGAAPLTEAPTAAKTPLPAERKGLDLKWLLRGLWNFLPYFWAAGALTLLVSRVLRQIWFYRSVKRLSVPPSGQQREALAETEQELGMRRKVRLRCFLVDSSPFVTGIFRPVIYIPAGLVGTEELKLAFRHELTHCARWDLLYKLAADLATVLHFFNPLVYLMRRRISENCEFSCDERVVGALGAEERRQYGMMLVRRAQADRRTVGGSVALFEKKTDLRKRVEIIMNRRQRKKWTTLVSTALILVMSVSCFALAGIVNAQNNTNPPRAVYTADQIDYASFYCEDNELPPSLSEITLKHSDGSAVYTSFAGITQFSASFFAINAEGQAILDDETVPDETQLAVFGDPSYYTDYYEVILNRMTRKYADSYGLEGQFSMTKNGETVFSDQTGYLTGLPPAAGRQIIEPTELQLAFQRDGKEVRFNLDARFEEVDSEQAAQERIRAAKLERSLESKKVLLGKVLASSIDGQTPEFERMNSHLDQSAAEGESWRNNTGEVLFNPSLKDADAALPMGTLDYARVYDVSACTEDTLTGRFLMRRDGVDVDCFTGTISGLSNTAGQAVSLKSDDGRYQASWEIVPEIAQPLTIYGVRDPEEFYTEGEEVYIGTPAEQDQFDRTEHDRLYKRIIVDENRKVLAVVPVEQQTGEALSSVSEVRPRSTGQSWTSLFGRYDSTVIENGVEQRVTKILQDPGTWWYKAVIPPENQYFEQKDES